MIAGVRPGGNAYGEDHPSMRRLLPLTVLILTGCGSPVSRLPDDPDRVVVYSIDGPGFQKNDEVLTDAQKQGEVLYRYRVLGKIEVADPVQRRAIVAAIKAGVGHKGGWPPALSPGTSFGSKRRIGSWTW
jgi:hypothetical protein